MKRFIRFISTGLSVLTFAAVTMPFAGAAKLPDCKGTKSVICSVGNISSCKSKKAVKAITVKNKRSAPKNCSNCSSLSKLAESICKSGKCKISLTANKKKASVSNQSKNTVSAEKASTNPTVQSAGSYNSSFEDEVISLVNKERAARGIAKLKKNAGATSVARIRATEIVKSFSHTRPDGSSCFTAATEQGVKYRTAGENIAYGYSSPEAVVNGWMNSDSHRKNILSASFTSIGVGCYRSGSTLYWSQFFIG